MKKKTAIELSSDASIASHRVIACALAVRACFSHMRLIDAMSCVALLSLAVAVLLLCCSCVSSNKPPNKQKDCKNEQHQITHMLTPSGRNHIRQFR